MRPPRRILLIEDDPDEAKRSRDSLAESGYAVLMAASFAAARRTITADTQFDLVFVDYHLPDGEGLMLIPHLRKAGVTAPVVLVTGNRSEQVGERAFRAGCADMAIKEPNYHLWLPTMAEAFIGAAHAGDPAEDFRWGPHVLGVCTGRLQGTTAHAEPADLWQPLAGALESATQLAVRGLRATDQSMIGSLPVVHLNLRSDRHLLLVLRAGVFSAALLSRAPKAQDTTELFGEAAAYARNRTGGEPGASAPAG